MLKRKNIKTCLLLILFLSFKVLLYAQKSNTLVKDYYSNVNQSLKNNLNSSDFRDIDIEKSYSLKLESSRSLLLLIPFKKKSISADFIALKTDSLGNCLGGSIIHVKNSTNRNTDTFYIHNLQRTKNQVVFLNSWSDLKKNKNVSKDQNTEILDPVILLSCTKDECLYYLNVFALLNPAQITKSGDEFVVKPTGITSGEFGTFSEYLNINQNASLSSIIKVEFEHPENLPAIDLKKELN